MDHRPINVLIVSQWSILTAGLERAIIAAWPDAAIATADGTLGALSAASATRFDLAVVQQDLAGVSGAITTHLIRTVSPETVSVLLVEQVTDVVTVTAIGHGVSAIIPTASTGPGLAGVARQALAGARPLDTVLIERPDTWRPRCSTTSARRRWTSRSTRSGCGPGRPSRSRSWTA